LLLCTSTDERLWRSPFNGCSQKKDAERRDKMGVRSGKESGSGKTGETFQSAGDVQKRTAGLGTKSNLREKRRDPWPRANVPLLREPTRARTVKMRQFSQACLDRVCGPVAQPPA